jgi:hypothetical protein
VLQYVQYQRFATEEFVLRAGGVLCPQPGCGMGILADPECTKITCINGCGVSPPEQSPSPKFSMFFVGRVCKVIT